MALDRIDSHLADHRHPALTDEPKEGTPAGSGLKLEYRIGDSHRAISLGVPLTELLGLDAELVCVGAIDEAAIFKEGNVAEPGVGSAFTIHPCTSK